MCLFIDSASHSIGTSCHFLIESTRSTHPTTHHLLGLVESPITPSLSLAIKLKGEFNPETFPTSQTSQRKEFVLTQNNIESIEDFSWKF